MLWSHQNNLDPIRGQELFYIKPIVSCGLQPYHNSFQSCCPALVLIPRFKTREAKCCIIESKRLLTDFHTAIIECSGPMLLASNVDSNHHGIIGNLFYLFILGIIHFGYLLFFRFANLRSAFLSYYGVPSFSIDRLPHRPVWIIQEARLSRLAPL